MPRGRAVRHDYTLDDAVADLLHRERLRRMATDRPRWNQKAVARRALGVTGACLNQWENRRANPTTLSEWAGWSRTYGLDLARLIADIDAGRA